MSNIFRTFNSGLNYGPGSRALRGKVNLQDDGFLLRENEVAYIADFESKNNNIAAKNACKWGVFP